MKKEILVAILIGFFIGVVAALTVTNLPKLLKSIKFQTVTKSPSPTISQIIETVVNPDINIESPRDESVSDTKSVNISGSIHKNNTILIESADDQVAEVASDSGRFSTKMNLREGANTIYFTVYDESGNSITKTLNVYYTTEKL